MPTTVFCILDGFGLAPESPSNAFSRNNAPFIHNLFKNHPWLMLDADGDSVGQEKGLVGNSEVGHMNLGGLQLVPQLSYEITDSARHVYNRLSRSQLCTPRFIFQKARSTTIHLVGLFSTGTIHSDLRHWVGVIESAQENNFQNIVLHLISDGRDSDRRSLVATWEEFTQKFKEKTMFSTQNITLGSLGGRYYAMDRDKNFVRTQKYLEALTQSTSKPAIEWTQVSPTLQRIVADSYPRNIYDETLIPQNFGASIQKNDVVWLINFRADRMKQLTQALVDYNYANKNKNIVLSNNNYGIGTEYLVSQSENTVLNNENSVYYPLFNKTEVENTFSDYCFATQKTLLQIAETEKFAHVTYFFNGGRQGERKNENQHIIPSHKVDSHAEKPEMRAVEITDYILEKGLGKYDYIVVNYANADMVGHTGDLEASQKAVRILDSQLQRLYNSVLEKNHSLLITADHGNVESVGQIDEQTYDTEHNANPVPCILISKNYNSTEVSTKAVQIALKHGLEPLPYLPLDEALTQAQSNADGFETWFKDYQPTYPLWIAGLLALSL